MDIQEGYKRCTKCGEIKPATLEFFYWRKDTNKYRSQCCQCEREKANHYYQSYPDKVRENVKRYRQKECQRIRLYRQKNVDKIREYNKQYCQNNLLKMRQKDQHREARKRSLPHNFTEQHWQHALTYFNGCCAYCGNPPSLFDYNTVLHQEHHIPVSKNGGYTPDNIIPACQSCNLNKSNKDPQPWVAERFGKKQGETILKKIQEYFEFFRFRSAEEMLEDSPDEFGLGDMFS